MQPPTPTIHKQGRRSLKETQDGDTKKPNPDGGLVKANADPPATDLGGPKAFIMTTICKRIFRIEGQPMVKLRGGSMSSSSSNCVQAKATSAKHQNLQGETRR
ncbi:unnamed protein product [Linum trigynum]|uniref:Uncharacterized protein n=1 Tax=Linum trigynum TaxID=586398 RepID=A0AAV2G884_9ROSI